MLPDSLVTLICTLLKSWSWATAKTAAPSRKSNKSLRMEISPEVPDYSSPAGSLMRRCLAQSYCETVSVLPSALHIQSLPATFSPQVGTTPSPRVEDLPLARSHTTARGGLWPAAAG